MESLLTVASEAEAALVVGALAERGIQAVAVGALTAQFKAEAPGAVRILVRHDDHDAAKLALAEIRPEVVPDSTPRVADDREPADRLPRLTAFGKAAAVLLLVASGIADVVCLVASLRVGDFDFFLGSLMGTALLVAVLLLWCFGPRNTRRADG
jgi:hypothetical protein